MWMKAFCNFLPNGKKCKRKNIHQKYFKNPETRLTKAQHTIS
jgi:hypothetical protein